MPTFLTESTRDFSDTLLLTRIFDDTSQQIGEARLSVSHPPVAILEDIYILRTHRGCHQGIALLKEVIQEARRQGATLLRCHPSPYERGQDEQNDRRPLPSKMTQAELIERYVAQGFREISPDSDEFQDHHCRLVIDL
jgi:GNAT superfamily N-acetyltransferase